MSLKAGAKAQITVDPLDFSGFPDEFGERVVVFIETYLVVPKGANSGELVQLADFQKDIIRGAFADGVRQGLVSIARANAKTTLAAMVAVAVLFLVEDSPEILVVASDQRQSTITLRLARRMIELAPELAERTHIYKDRLVTPQNDGLLLPLPADPAALHGWDPTLLIVDELHVVSPDTWEACTSVAGKRPRSLTLAISTPASSPDSVMWKLVEHGRSGTDPSFFFKEFAAPDGCAVDDREAWRIANPAMTCERPFLFEDGLEAAMRTIREPVFRQLRLGQWVTGVEAWLPWGVWDACAVDRSPQPRERVVLAFDGSASGDSTALVGCTLDGHLWVEGLWENPGDPRWRVPREDVTNAVDMAFQRYDVVELSADPWGWRSEIEEWGKRHGDKRVIEFNTAAAARMAPATDRLYQAVVTNTVTHDGDPDLAAHVAHCVAKRTPAGDLVSKDKKGSPRKIDAAVAAIVAFDRAAWHVTNKPRKRTRSFA